MDIVVGNYLIQHDFDITAFNHEKGYIPNIGTFMEADKYLLAIAKKSGDIFLTDIKMSQKINYKFKAVCVEMEGASIAQVAKLCNVPFLIIRSISDVLGEDNKMTYETFLEKSCDLIVTYLKKMLNNLSKNENNC